MNLKLKLEILRRHQSQYECAKALGISESLLSRIVRGRKDPTPTLRRKISRHLGISENEIFPKN
jgi:transcriptional regulator with XRE-family HTH domain